MSGRTDNLRRLVSREAAKGRLVITGHNAADADSMISGLLLQVLLARWGVAAEVRMNAPSPQARSVLKHFGVGVQALEGQTEAQDKLILVDHHQAQQPGQVIACMDHHPVREQPGFSWTMIEPSGACAMLMLRLWQEAGFALPGKLEALAVAAMYLDTLGLRCTKILPGEAQWAKERARALGLDEGWLEREGMGLQDMRLAPRLLATQDQKTYDFSGYRVLSSCLRTDQMTPKQLEAILDVLRMELLRLGAARWVFLWQDPVNSRTVRFDLYDDGRVERQAYDRLISRGTDVMPAVEREVRREKAE